MSADLRADAHYVLGLAYFIEGKVDAAIGQYKETLRINSNHAAAHLMPEVAHE